jgi:hypothetical protein
VFKWFLYLNEDSVLGSIKTLMNSEKLFEIVHQLDVRILDASTSEICYSKENTSRIKVLEVSPESELPYCVVS